MQGEEMDARPCQWIQGCQTEIPLGEVMELGGRKYNA